MSRSGWFRRGAIAGDQMFAVGLAVVIVGALAATFYFTMMDHDKKEMTEEQKQTWFECSKCDEQFFLTPETTSMGMQRILEQLGTGLKPYTINCQKCGAKNRAFQMLKCPNPDCSKRYVPARFRNPLKQQQNPEKYKDICPHCNMEFMDAYKKGAAAK